MIFHYQLNSYKKQNGTQSIRLRFFTSANDIQYLKTELFVLKNQWDTKKQIVKKHSLEENYNAKLNALKNELEKLHYKNQGVSAKRLLNIYRSVKEHDTSSFLDFYQNLVNEMKLSKKIRTASTNQNYIKKLKEYSNHISFNDLSPLWARDYERWMRLRGNKTNTIASNFKSIYAALNKAVNLGLIDKNHIKGYTITTENVEKQSLTLDEIDQIINLEIEPRYKGMVKARDMLLFSFYTAGMRFTDMCKLKHSSVIDDNIIYTMNKSKSRSGSRRQIPLNPKSKEIVEKYKGGVYVFSILEGINTKDIELIEHKIYIANNNLNRALKIIAKSCEIDKPLSMHIAKHSFADYLVKKDISLLMISKLLGHTKLSTTQSYLKDFYHKEESDTMNELFK